ncbi:Scr1 family TA system antitoxin-like transcriptional regulator [Streptomyces sp. NPDC001941]|uniref:Scr1 family TA system antitoxin-like transcriptional regulator n=1 Tax=Streptomyces sp. NPDC001941 TaxID=3154659 RepID=UPI003323DCEB
MTFDPEELGRSGSELAATLRELRRRSALSGERVARRMNVSQSKVSRIENGRTRPTLVDVEQYLKAVDAPERLVAEVLALARVANTQWQDIRGMRRRGLDKKQAELAGLEATTTEFRFFLLSMVTGLLSTPEYIRKSLAHVPGDHSAVIARKIDRQRVLYDPEKRFTFILTEQAVRNPFLEPSQMGVQIDHLASLTHVPGVRLGVIPLDHRMPGNPLDTFTVYDQRIATVELTAGVMVFRDARDVHTYLDLFREYEQCALFGEAAREVLGEWAAKARA